MDGENMQQGRAIPRCRVCRLKPDALAEVHRERLAWNVTYEEIAQKLRASGHETSASSLRRHFRAHIQNSQLEDGQESLGDLNDIATPFDGLLAGKIREQDVTEAVVKVLVQRMQRLEKEQVAVRDQSRAERLWNRSLKTMAMLERSLKRLQDIRQPERDVKAMVGDALRRAGPAMIAVYKTVMNDQIAVVKQALYDLLDKRLQPEELLRQISRWERDWPMTVASRIAEANILSFRQAGAQV